MVSTNIKLFLLKPHQNDGGGEKFFLPPTIPTNMIYMTIFFHENKKGYSFYIDLSSKNRLLDPPLDHPTLPSCRQ